MSTTPEQLDATAVEPDAEKAAMTRPTGDDPTPPSTGEELVVEDLLVEDVSIDGMCGVY